MNFLGNLLWLVLGGLVITLIYTIPWCMYHFKMAVDSIFPFGKKIQ